MAQDELDRLIEGCRLGDRRSQQALYRQYYGLAMSVCVRYAHNREEAVEMCNDGFMKVFMKIGDCSGVASFKGWLWKIMERAAIDYFRKYLLHQPPTDDINDVAPVIVAPTAVDALSAEEKLKMVQALPPVCRLVFNLYAVEGYSTAEIAEMTCTAEGTVRANLAKARLRLQGMIHTSEKINTST